MTPTYILLDRIASPSASSGVKDIEHEGAKLYERWTPTARLAVFDTKFFGQNVFVERGWGMGAHFQGAATERRWLEQDGSAGTPIIRFDDPRTNLEHLLFDVTSVGYQLRNPKRVCIIGVGGGRDVHTARLSGATHIDGVELNGGIVDLVSGPMGQYSGDVYHLPGVRTHVSEGRSFLTRTENEYDLIHPLSRAPELRDHGRLGRHALWRGHRLGLERSRAP